MAEWFYTTNNKQMGPISWDELRQLAATGLLDAGDMVWKEGMVDWLKANKVNGLFSERSGAGREDIEDRPRRRRRENDEDEDDDRPRRRRSSAGMPLGAKVAIIGGSIAVGLLILVVVVVLLLRGGGGMNAVGPGQFQFTLFRGQERSHYVRFNAGQMVRISVNSQAAPNTDVDLFVYRNNNAQIAADTRVSKDCFLQFVAPVTDQYRVRVVNLGPGNATCNLVIQ